MASTLGGDDPSHDLTTEQKDKEEKKLRAEARKLLGGQHKKERTRKLNRANEISRDKAKRAHQGAD
jgi:hypothetical protein